MDASKLQPGDDHYMAYVGPPTQYDFMGATQFRLLCTLGLRAHHDFLDFGCGSLRGGRLFLSYLDEGKYCGIEPNEWLINDAIENQVGKDLIGIKKPRFDHNIDFATDVFAQPFDFIVAQSIFSHTGPDLIAIALRNFAGSLKPDGLVVATFIEGGTDFDGTGWVYAGSQEHVFHPASKTGRVTYRRSTIRRFAAEAGLTAARIPWYHPRQTWYLLAKDRSRLPGKAMFAHLRGAVLSQPEFAASWSRKERAAGRLKTAAVRMLPKSVREYLKRKVRDR